MASAFIGLLGGIPQSNSRNDDDIADRLNHRYTVSLLIIMSLVVTSKQYVGDRIQCWHPAHFAGSWEEYTNSYCWVKDTYYLPFEDHIPKAHEEDKRQRLTYYQWVPLILLAQAFLYYMPIMLWRALNERSGIDVNNIIETAEDFNETSKVEEKNSALLYMTRHMHRYLDSRRQIAKKDCVVGCTTVLTRICFCFSRNAGNYLIPLYVFTKLLFIINGLGQLFVLSHILGTDYHLYGLKWIASHFNDIDFGASEAFPRVTMCDFYVRRLGNVQRYTVQCVLPINLFNELVYLIIWFWMVIVVTATIISTMSWVARTIFVIDRHRYIRKHLGLIKHPNRLPDSVLKAQYEDPDADPDDSDDSITLMKRRNKERDEMMISRPDPLNWDRHTFAKFVDEYLKADGVFVIRLIQHNTNSLTVQEFLANLWEFYNAEVENAPPVYHSPTI